MRIENEFTVPADIETVWNHLLDVERVVPCVPGAELTEVVDDTTWKGLTHVKFGPVAMEFAGTVSMTERDDEKHRVTLSAKGQEQKGKGAATASVSSWLEEVDSGTKVQMEADITITGAAAQLSRGLLPEISKRLTQQFADCLASSITAEVAPQGEIAIAAPPGAPKPVRGIGLGLSALWAKIAGFFRRLFGGSKMET
jgi:carbon monoxide dehydrogenase subunit G